MHSKQEIGKIGIRIPGGTLGGTLRALAMLALAGLLVSGCSKEQTGSDKPARGSDSDAPGTGTPATGAPTATTGGRKKIVFVFKIGNISYSEACKAGAEQANNDPALGVEVQYQASVEGTAEKQNDIIESAIVGHADAIVVSPVDSKAIVPTLNKAAEKGIKVFTWDADAPTSKRLFYVAAVDDVQIGTDVADALAKDMGDKGKVLLFSGQSTAENLNKHVEGIQKGMSKHPGITVLQPTIYNDDKLDKAKSDAIAALQANPGVTGIACANSVSPRGAGEALRALGRVGKVKVWGLGLPSETKPYLLDGSVSGLYLWDPQKLTYFTAKLVKEALDGHMPQDGATLGDAGTLSVQGPIVVLPLRLEINKQNVESLKF